MKRSEFPKLFGLGVWSSVALLMAVTFMGGMPSVLRHGYIAAGCGCLVFSAVIGWMAVGSEWMRFGKIERDLQMKRAMTGVTLLYIAEDDMAETVLRSVGIKESSDHSENVKAAAEYLKEFDKNLQDLQVQVLEAKQVVADRSSELAKGVMPWNMFA